MTTQSAEPGLRRDDVGAERWFERFRTPLAIGLAVCAIFVLAALTSNSFVTKNNLIAVLRVASVTGIVAVCATSITLSGNFFSVALGQTAVLSSRCLLVLRAHGGFRAGCGRDLRRRDSGSATRRDQWSSSQSDRRDARSLVAARRRLRSDDRLAVDTPPSNAVNFIGSSSPLGISTQTWMFGFAIVVVTVIARKNRLGRETLLTGANRATATGSGIGVSGVTIAAFVAAAIGAAIVGIFETAQFSQATTTTFTTLDFDVIAAILVGGTAAGGGEGSALRSALGGLFIALVSNYMLLPWPQGTITTVEGALVLIAVVTFHLLRRRAER